MNLKVVGPSQSGENKEYNLADVMSGKSDSVSDNPLSSNYKGKYKYYQNQNNDLDIDNSLPNTETSTYAIDWKAYLTPENMITAGIGVGAYVLSTDNKFRNAVLTAGLYYGGVWYWKKTKQN
jgi:hypothetical protein